MKAKILLLPGDGIGPEVTSAAHQVLAKVATFWDHQFEFETALLGGIAMDTVGHPLPQATVEAAQSASAVFLGAIGGPKWDDPRAKFRPEQGLLGLRKALDVFANLRPVTVYPSLFRASPLKEDRLKDVDMLVVRELTGGIYFGEKTRTPTSASDACVYTVHEIERIAHMAAKLACNRKRLLVSVDKANVLETSRLWRETITRVIRDHYPDVKLEHMLVDAAAMHLIRKPSAFDVVVTENMFGDILTDEASMITGSLGMLPSASLSASGPGLFEPIHGSAPDIAGQGVANPVGAILSAALLLRHGLGLEKEAAAVEHAVAAVIQGGYGTPDLDCGARTRTTKTLTELICQNLEDASETTVYEHLAMNISALGC